MIGHLRAAALLAALHHIAALTIACALAAELGLLQEAPSSVQARRLQRIDLHYGLTAGGCSRSACCARRTSRRAGATTGTTRSS